jgi:hypothetical protein
MIKEAHAPLHHVARALLLPRVGCALWRHHDFHVEILLVHVIRKRGYAGRRRVLSRWPLRRS